MSDNKVVAQKTLVVDMDKKVVTKLIYRALVTVAENKTTINYETLTKQLGLVMKPHHYGQYYTPLLDDINTWCRDRNIPPLSVLVIRTSGEKKGLPVVSFFNHITEHTVPGESIDHVVMRDHSGNPVPLTNTSRRRLTDYYQEMIYRLYDISQL